MAARRTSTGVRRTQAERTEATTAELLAAAQRLFGRDGYAATSLAAVAAEAGMSKGAAYHHFSDKAGLFRAVFVLQEQQLAESLTDVGAKAGDSLAALHAACTAFLEHCLDQQTRQIVLLDGPAVLGWDAVREIEYRYTLRLLRTGMRAAARDGWIAAGELDVRAQLIFGALCEAGMLLARAHEPEGLLSVMTTEVELLLGVLARPADGARGGSGPGHHATRC